MISGFLGRRKGKAPSRDRGGDRNSQRPSAARSLDNSMDLMEGVLMGGEKGGIGGEKHMTHREWTKEPFPDDFDDSDLE